MTPSAPDGDYDVVVVGSGFGGSVAALRLAEKICGSDVEAVARVCGKLSATGAKYYSVAQVYRACA